ncbi:hypothetical protein AVEN_253492-1 [Araneus ventricosus]|uniref:Integrase zinc-binding domain-containing protein n=1 Tax=Araneus ventricosus TaxID=182803 RepID=A0A4Y2BU86_ARAVE|nr:hypothetical protein AVEN_253492-1 [Araneus ventricosus]
MKHGGIATILAKIRSHFWIPKVRQIVQKIIRRCLICRRYSAKSEDQHASQLPEDRIAQTPPFYTSGVDFVGPIYVKNLKECRTRICTYYDYGILFDGFQTVHFQKRKLLDNVFGQC